jgi:hypothetical protein
MNIEQKKQMEANWMIPMLFHKSNLNRVKKGTGAYHVIHVKNHVREKGGKVDCLLIRGEEGEVKYGGSGKDFNQWTEEDYTNAINSYNNEFSKN